MTARSAVVQRQHPGRRLDRVRVAGHVRLQPARRPGSALNGVAVQRRRPRRRPPPPPTTASAHHPAADHRAAGRLCRPRCAATASRARPGRPVRRLDRGQPGLFRRRHGHHRHRGRAQRQPRRCGSTARPGYCNHVFIAVHRGPRRRRRRLVRPVLGPAHHRAARRAHHDRWRMRDAADGNRDLRLGGQNGALQWNRASDDATLPEQSPAGVALSRAAAHRHLDLRGVQGGRRGRHAADLAGRHRRCPGCSRTACRRTTSTASGCNRHLAARPHRPAAGLGELRRGRRHPLVRRRRRRAPAASAADPFGSWTGTVSGAPPW